MSYSAGNTPLKFQGCAQFRQRIVFATLSGRRIRIDNIRDKDEEPGLKGSLIK
jgi:RNA 3'-terminal phosphate cyclase-like protein